MVVSELYLLGRIVTSSVMALINNHQWLPLFSDWVIENSNGNYYHVQCL